jgi:hypothetical protein
VSDPKKRLERCVTWGRNRELEVVRSGCGCESAPSAANRGKRKSERNYDQRGRGRLSRTRRDIRSARPRFARRQLGMSTHGACGNKLAGAIQCLSAFDRRACHARYSVAPRREGDRTGTHSVFRRGGHGGCRTANRPLGAVADEGVRARHRPRHAWAAARNGCLAMEERHTRRLLVRIPPRCVDDGARDTRRFDGVSPCTTGHRVDEANGR